MWLIWIVWGIVVVGAVEAPQKPITPSDRAVVEFPQNWAVRPVLTPKTTLQVVVSTPNPSIKEVVLKMVAEAGFDPYIADKVVQCESGWNPNAIGDAHLGYSYGLWQLHQPAHQTGDKAFDPIWATEYAIILLDKHGWYPWTCYRKLFL